MAIIKLSTPDGPYKVKLDTDVMDVEITHTYIGVKFKTVDGELLYITMRDGGYELVYEVNGVRELIELQVGKVKRVGSFSQKEDE